MTSTFRAPAVSSETTGRLTGIVATAFRIARGAVRPDTPFTSLGMDSLSAVELTMAVDDAFGVSLDPSVVYEHCDVRSLAAYLSVFIDDSMDVRLHARSQHAPDTGVELMFADSILPAEIVPARHTALLSGRTPTVLLTGATGFLGGHLLRATLETGSTVHCLVRARSVDDGLERIRCSLARSGGWRPDVADRIRIVIGDLTLPGLGLGRRRLRALADSIDVILHCAAAVNWVQPYDALRDANVLGTRELLRFACLAAPKPFHFVSSLAVCYSTLGPREIDELDDPLLNLRGLHLGYAQSKCVAESLVREAGARGLPVTIVRPALVTGHSTTGESNNDDLLSRFIKGCIELHCAPDLDWCLDAVPVDHVADTIVRLLGAREAGARVVHVANPRSRSWRECVLWMRLYGYPLNLVPYGEWVSAVRHAAMNGDHALAPLIPFLCRAAPGPENLTLPQLFEETRRARARCERSNALLAAHGIGCPPLSGQLLERYFARYVDDGYLPSPASHSSRASPQRPASLQHPMSRAQAHRDVCGPSLERLMPELERSLAARMHEPSVRVANAELSPMSVNDSIVAELTSWRGGAPIGLFRACLTVDRPSGGRTSVSCVVKAKPKDQTVIEVGETVARLCSPALGDAYTRFRSEIGFTKCHEREIALYRDPDRRLRAHAPALLASIADDERGEWILLLEDIADSTVMNSADHLSAWTPEHVECAIRGLAQLHAVWFGRDTQRQAPPWLAPARTAVRRVDMIPLWAALADHARSVFTTWTSPSIAEHHRRLACHAGEWAPTLDAQCQTLIHNDFNPRNVALRVSGALAPRLCAYDWELATIGAPQRDLAEFLCFVLPPSVTRDEADRWISLHRSALEHETGVTMPAAEWRSGFSAALCDFLVDRLAMYAMVDRFRRQSFLPRVLRTWTSLNGHYPWPPS